MKLNSVYLVDDDDAVRISLIRSLEHHGYMVQAFESGTEFVEVAPSLNYGCIILDVAMPGLSGIDVQSKLAELNCHIPIIFVTGHGDVPTSVRALKNGAIEFLEKPFSLEVLMERVEAALQLDTLRREKDQLHSDTLTKFRTLTKREADVMVALTAGRADKSNKVVARELDISHRTVEEYRSRIFVKMEASSITHLVEMAKKCDIYKS